MRSEVAGVAGNGERDGRPSSNRVGQEYSSGYASRRSPRRPGAWTGADPVAARVARGRELRAVARERYRRKATAGPARTAACLAGPSPGVVSSTLLEAK